MNRRLLCAVLIGLAGAASGCGSSDSSSSSNSSNGGGNSSSSSASAGISDPCSLLALSDVTAALQKPTLQSAKDSSLPTGPSCSWTVPTDPNATASLDLSSVNLASQDLVVFNGSKTAANPQFQVVPVSGVGDDAFFQVNSAASGSRKYLILVKKGTTCFQLSVNNSAFSDQQTQDAEKKLAGLAAAKI